MQHINSGIHYHFDNLDYPIRKIRAERYDLNNKHSAFYGREASLLELVKDLKDNVLSYAELEDKYNIKTTTLSLIN